MPTETRWICVPAGAEDAAKLGKNHRKQARAFGPVIAARSCRARFADFMTVTSEETSMPWLLNSEDDTSLSMDEPGSGAPAHAATWASWLVVVLSFWLTVLDHCGGKSAALKLMRSATAATFDRPTFAMVVGATPTPAAPRGLEVPDPEMKATIVITTIAVHTAAAGICTDR